MKNRKNNDIEIKLEDAMLAFHRKVMFELVKEAKRLKFTPSQLEVLHYVAEKENPTMKDIAEHLHIKPPSVTTIIEALVAKKLLQKEFDEKDKRITRILITRKCWKLFSVLKNKKVIILKNLFSQLNIEDKKALIKIFNTINK